MRYLLSLFLFAFISCEDDVLVKPNALLRLEYPIPNYSKVENGCGYSFSKNDFSNLIVKPNCGLNLYYPKMKATIYITYLDVKDNNLDSLLRDAQKLTYDHTIKAESIFEQPRVDSIKKVYGMFYMINGDAASQSQFYVTDSIRHFLTGSLYFEAKPNFDSIYPGVEYLREDIRKLMETISWEEIQQ